MTTRGIAPLLATLLFGSCSSGGARLPGRDGGADFPGTGSGGASATGTGGATAGATGGSGGGGEGGGAGSGGEGTPVDAGASGGAGGRDASSPPPKSVTMERQGALGFCISPGQVLQAELAADAAGELVVSGKIHRGWDDDPATCAAGRCSVTEPLGPTPLGAARQAELEALVAALQASTCTPLLGSAAICDPCLLTRVTVDGVSILHNPCEAASCPARDLALLRLITFFDRFVPQCAATLPVRCGDRLSHDTIIDGRANLWGTYGRTARAESGREVVYAFTSDRLCTVTASLKNLTTDLDLLLLSACDPIGSNEMASSTPLDLQTVETVTWTNTPGQMSTLVVDGYAGAEGAYTLEVDCTCREQSPGLP